MSYTKKLATIVVTTTSGAFTITDTLECPVATQVLATLQKHGDAYVSTDDGDFMIPFNAVSNVQISYEDSEPITPPSPCGD